MPPLRTLVCTTLALGAAGLAHAQATVKPDGQWRAVFGLGLSYASGNANATNLSMSGDAVRATWDAGLAVAMTQGLNLTLGLSVLYDSDPRLGRKATDMLFTTGVAVKFE